MVEGNFVLVLEEPAVAPLAPGWGKDFRYREVGRFDDEDLAMDAGIGIVTGLLAKAKYPHPNAEPGDYHGAALVFAEEDRQEDGTFNRRDERMGVDSGDVTDLAKVWNP